MVNERIRVDPKFDEWVRRMTGSTGLNGVAVTKLLAVNLNMNGSFIEVEPRRNSRKIIIRMKTQRRTNEPKRADNILDLL